MTDPNHVDLRSASGPVELAAARRYLDRMQQEYELHRYRMSRHRLFGEMREPATYGQHINLWVPWWPWRIVSSVRVKSQGTWGFVRGRIRDTWNVLLHGLPEGDW